MDGNKGLPVLEVGRGLTGVKKIVYVNYFSDDENKLGLKTKVNVRVIRNWGTDKVEEESANVALISESKKQLVYKTQVKRSN